MKRIKMTNNEAFESLTALAKVTEKGKLGYAIAKNRRKLKDELKEYNEKRDELLKEYGRPGKKPGIFEFTEENARKFQNAIAEYDSIECEVNIMTVPEDVFISGTLTSQQMYDLDWMVEE